MSKVTVITVLRTQPFRTPHGRLSRFTSDHADWLHRQIAQHWQGDIACLSDRPVRGAKEIPLIRDWPGWWAKMELFRPDIKGDLLYMDLDTVIVGDLTPMASAGQFTMLRDFYRSGNLGSGLMYLPEADRAELWEAWNRQPEAEMGQHQTNQSLGDQGFIQSVRRKPVALWQDLLPGSVISYKVNQRRLPPPGTRVVCFHGIPRPWQVFHPWVPRLTGPERRFAVSRPAPVFLNETAN